MFNIIILGPAGAGKGTQSKLLSKTYSIPHISTGDLFRERILANDELAKYLSNEMSKGNLISDEIMFDILKERLQKKDCINGFILDGFPRTLQQAEEFDTVLKRINNKETLAFVLEMPENVLIERISGRFMCSKCNAVYNKFYENTLVDGICDICGSTDFKTRADDLNIDSIRRRISIYKDEFGPIIDFYRKKNLIYFVNGFSLKQKVHEDIKNIINEKIN